MPWLPGEEAPKCRRELSQECVGVAPLESMIVDRDAIAARRDPLELAKHGRRPLGRREYPLASWGQCVASVLCLLDPSKLSDRVKVLCQPRVAYAEGGLQFAEAPGPLAQLDDHVCLGHLPEHRFHN